MFVLEKTIDDVIKNHTYFDNRTKVNLINRVEMCFSYFVNISKTYLVEEYIENEWRDSYDLYYSKTNYTKCNNYK